MAAGLAIIALPIILEVLKALPAPQITLAPQFTFGQQQLVALPPAAQALPKKCKCKRRPAKAAKHK